MNLLSGYQRRQAGISKKQVSSFAFLVLGALSFFCLAGFNAALAADVEKQKSQAHTNKSEIKSPEHPKHDKTTHTQELVEPSDPKNQTNQFIVVDTDHPGNGEGNPPEDNNNDDKRFIPNTKYLAGNGSRIEIPAPGMSEILRVISANGSQSYAIENLFRSHVVHHLILSDDYPYMVVGSFQTQMAVQDHQIVSRDGDLFVMCLNKQGDVEWIRRVGGDGLEQIQSVSVLDSGSLQLNLFMERIDEPLINNELQVASGNHYIVEIDLQGKLAWLERL